MKDSKEKEHRISNLKDMINNIKEDNESPEFDNLEEDNELIEYLNEDSLDYEKLEIDDEYIYHPGDENSNAIDLEENDINEDYLIKTPKIEDVEKNDSINEIEEFDDELAGEISESFDNVINAKVRGRPVLAIVSSVLGIIFLILSAYIFQSRSDRIIDNVVAGETNFMFVIFVVVGLLLLIYGVYKLFNIKNPFEHMTNSINSIEEDKKDDKNKDTAQTIEKPSPKAIPKSNIPLDKESYKIGEFDMEDLKNSLKKPTVSKKSEEEDLTDEEVEDLPPAKEKSQENDLTDEEMRYEKAKLEYESIDDIFAEVEDIEDIEIISIDSKEEK